MRLTDLQKWTKGCKTVEDVRDMVVKEQLLDALPRELKIWLAERNPNTSQDAAELADTYLRARRLECRSEQSGNGGPSWNRDTREVRDAPRDQVDGRHQADKGLHELKTGRHISRNGPYIGGHLAFYFKLNFKHL